MSQARVAPSLHVQLGKRNVMPTKPSDLSTPRLGTAGHAARKVTLLFGKLLKAGF